MVGFESSDWFLGGHDAIHARRVGYGAQPTEINLSGSRDPVTTTKHSLAVAIANFIDLRIDYIRHFETDAENLKTGYVKANYSAKSAEGRIDQPKIGSE